MPGPPIILRPKPLDLLDDFHNEIRRRRKTRDQPMTFESIELWRREARRRFGPNSLGWTYRCHHCGTVFSTADYMAARAPMNQVGFACLGAFLPDDKLPCNYDGTNLKPANPVVVLVGDAKARMLAFAGD